MHAIDLQRNEKCKTFATITTEELIVSNKKDSKDMLLDSNLYALKLNDHVEKRITCPLAFWKENENFFLPLAELTRKYLSVPASSACEERMFSIAGHIFCLKRRRLGTQCFMDLV